MSRFDNKPDSKKYKADFEGTGGELADFSEVGSPKENLQEKNHRLFSREPVSREIGEREIVFSIVSGVKKLHTKINGEMLSVVLT